MMTKPRGLALQCDCPRVLAFRRRRDGHDIMVAILAYAKNGARKTRLIQKIGLSHSQFTQYVGDLAKAGLIDCDDGVMKATERGKKVVEAFEIYHDLIEQALGAVPKPSLG